ncbi:TRAP transporter small permease subunit [Chloroflexota bacterium]
MNLVRKVKTFFDSINNLLATLAGILVIFIMLSVVYDVVMRYFLQYRVTWTLEITSYCLLFITFLGTAWVLRREGHVKMDLLLNRLKPKHQATVNIITSIICAIVCLIVAWYSAETTWSSFQIQYRMASELRPPQYLTLFVIPMGSFLLFIQFLRRAYGYLRSQIVY